MSEPQGQAAETRWYMARWLPKDRFAQVVIIFTLVFYSFMLWYPILDEFAFSFYSGLTLRRTWVGTENYQRLLNDQAFRGAIVVTLKYAVIVVPIAVALGLLLAAILNSIRNLFVRTTLTSLFFFPHMVPLAATASFWKFLLAPTHSGAINSMLALVGIGPIKWLEAVNTALLSLAFVAIWGSIGYVMVLLLAGMQSIPRNCYEAASIDGADAWNRFLYITIPLLMPMLSFVIIILTLGSLMMFEPVYIMTGGNVSHAPKGGPAGSTTTIVYLIYETAFISFKQGYAAAMAVVWFFVMLVLGFLQFRLMSRSRIEY